jgi:hypothetical protein
MGSEFVFEALKAHIRARGMTYKDVARALNLSEPTVKRIFSERDCTLKRLDQICDVVQVDLQEISRGASSQARLINQLSAAQEQEIVSDISLFIVAVCTMQSLTLEDITTTYRLDDAKCVALLTRLDRIGFIELLPNNRYRTRVAKSFKWLPDGPIMRWTKAHAADYFDHLFNGSGEMLRVINVRLAKESRMALLGRLEQVALEYAEQHNSDSWLPMDQRQPLSLCLAVRPWEPEPFRAMRRR